MMAISDRTPILAENQRMVLQEEIDQRKTLRERNRKGQFATPLALAIDIVRALESHVDTGMPIHFGEPAIGTGAFFSALLQVFPAEQIVSAIGVEIDPEFAQAARTLWEYHDLKVIEGDFTDPAVMARAQPQPTLILTNPPYVRHHHLEQQQKTHLQSLAARATGLRVNGLAGLYVYYMLIAHTWLKEGGLATWLIPSEFMDVNYGAALQQYLIEQVTLLSIHRFDPQDVQFADALVSSAVVTFRKTPPSPEAKVKFTFSGKVSKPALSQDVALTELRTTRKWTTYPQRDQPGAPRVQCPDSLLLSDLFRIQRGIATGANDFFIMPRSEAQSKGLPEAFLRPILPSPRYLRETIIESDPDGFPKIHSQFVLIDTDLPEEELHTRCPALWEYLRTAGERGLLERYLIKQRQPWYRQERREPAPFLCTYMGRGVDDQHPFRFILNRSRATVPNVYLALYPKEPLAFLLRQHPGLDETVLGLLCRITAADLKGEGRVYGGGLHKIEPNELGRISAAAFLDAIPELRHSNQPQLVLNF